VLPLVVLVALVPAIVILALGIAVRLVARQPVSSPIVQYLPERGSTVLRDALLADADKQAVAAALIDLAVHRKIRLHADVEGDRRAPIGVSLVEGAVFTREELAVLEAVVGPDHTPGRLRRFSADRRALGLRVRALLRDIDYSLARDGLVAPSRIAWPGTTLTTLAYLGMLSEAVLLVIGLIAGDWLAVALTVVALAATILTVIVTPASWRKFLPAATPRREHLDGLRRYLTLAEADRLRALQSPQGALVVADGPTAHAPQAVGEVADPARDPVARFHLNERLLPYAVLFGVEKQWLAQLRLEAAADASNLQTVGDLVEVTAELAQIIELVGGAVQLVSSLGELADGAGNVVEGASGFFELFNV
jgi:X-X-X-Leu-X-X-Gly heptad repeat protein